MDEKANLILTLETNKAAITKTIADIQRESGISNYEMSLILSDILCNYRSNAMFEYTISSVIHGNKAAENTTKEETV